MSPQTAYEAWTELQAGPRFSALVAEVQGVIGDAVAAYGERVAHRPPPGAKALKDAVWGMIDLSEREVIVLDSPPLQRLRRIRQLGLTYLTYPTAGYSRFEHTVGTAHQAERMLRAIAKRSEKNLEATLLEAISVVRLSALLHDMGHLPFSHVAERYYSAEECEDDEVVKWVSALRSEVAHLLQVPEPGLAEVLSLAAASSDAMRALIVDVAGYSQEDCAAATLAIVGRPPTLERAFVAQVVTNVIDADKLDYMFRDAFLTRVPVAVDLERLLYKLRCLRVSAQLLPRPLRAIAAHDEQANVLGSDLAGSNFAHDLSLSRAMLYDRIYYHHKTRCAERLALEGLSKLHLPVTMLLDHDDGLLSRYGIGYQVAPDIVDRLENRRLPRRCFAIGYSAMLQQAPTDEQGRPKPSAEQEEAWQRLQDALASPPLRRRLDDNIAQRLREFGIQDPAQIWVDSQPRPRELEISDLLVELPDGKIDKGDSFPAAASGFTRSPDAMSFIYSAGDDEQLTSCLIACELAVADEFRLYFGRDSADRSKINWEKVETEKRRLETRLPDLYLSHGRLRPRSRLARGAELHPRIEAIAHRLGQYHAVSNVRVDTHRTVCFLDQFPEDLVEPMVMLLESLTYLDRDNLSRLVDGFQDRIPADAAFVPITSSPEKSASHIAYYFADRVGGRVMELAAALHEDRPVVFFDDCVLSGIQASEVIETWFGNGPRDDDQIAAALTEDQIGWLRTRQVFVAVAYARRAGLEVVGEALRTHGVDVAAMLASIEDRADKGLDSVLGEHAAKVRAFLRQVGRAVLLTTKGTQQPVPWPAEKCSERALGYGNLEELVATLYNTPTGTLTALWKRGIFRDTEWMPLLPRRGEE